MIDLQVPFLGNPLTYHDKLLPDFPFPTTRPTHDATNGCMSPAPPNVPRFLESNHQSALDIPPAVFFLSSEAQADLD